MKIYMSNHKHTSSYSQLIITHLNLWSKHLILVSQLWTNYDIKAIQSLLCQSQSINTLEYKNTSISCTKHNE